MTYRILWGAKASAAATDAMTAANLRGESIGGVVSQIVAMDRELATDPTALGESREANVRVHTADGLTVFFEAIPRVGSVFVRRAVFFKSKSES